MGRRDGDPQALTAPPTEPRRPPPLPGRRPSASRALLGALTAALLAVVGVRLIGGERGAVLVLLVGALPLLLLAAYPLVVGGLLLRSRAVTVGAGALVVAHLAVVAPALGAEPLPAGAAQAPQLRVVVANLYRQNPDPEQAAAFLRGLEADVLVVPELDPRGRAAFAQAGLLADLPHGVEGSGEGDETVGLLSRLPLRDVVLRRIGGRVQPQVTVDVDGTAVRVFAVHPLPPLGGLAPLWRAALVDTALQAVEVDLPLVVAGDLNAGRGHAVFRRLLDTGLRDVHDERGRGLVRTWPASFPLLHLDHVLVRDAPAARLVPLSVREVEVPGSDHLGVVTDLAVLGR